MIIDFLVQNFYFSASLIAAITSLAASWLFTDAGFATKNRRSVVGGIGFLILTLGFVLQPLDLLFTAVVRQIGYFLVFLSLFKAPAPGRPQLVSLLPASSIFIVVPLLPIVCSLQYLYKATVGLEKHLKPLFVYFFLLAIFESLLIPLHLPTFTQPQMLTFQNPSSLNAILAFVVLLFSSLLLLKWVFHYLLTQFFPQLFFFTSLISIAVIILTTVGFSGTLLQNLIKTANSESASSSQVMRLAIESIANEQLAQTQTLTANPQTIAVSNQPNRQAIADHLNQILNQTNIDSLSLIDTTGNTIYTTNDPDRPPAPDESLVVRLAKSNESAWEFNIDQSTPLPSLLLTAASTASTTGESPAVLRSDNYLDQAFVSGLKSRTGFEVVLFAANQVVASTQPDLIPPGIFQNDTTLTNLVLKDAQPVSEETMLGNFRLLGTYSPLLDSDGTSIGMIFIGTPLSAFTSQLQSAFSIVFTLSIIVLTLTSIPIFLVSRYISHQVR